MSDHIVLMGFSATKQIESFEVIRHEDVYILIDFRYINGTSERRRVSFTEFEELVASFV